MNIAYVCTFIYGAFALRIVIATVLNNFEREERTLILSAEQEKSARSLARLALILLIGFWPLFLLFYPKCFFDAFILNKKSAINRMSFIVGMKMGRTSAMIQSLFDKLY